ncbi:Lead, cadmium, zinc and mercury transporting ATPase [Desulfosporosinus sp. I2]|nr:Lead, cadmium, zinc and mercury transporting ATPase [Desulfosporosinus sp. I2]
MATNLEIRSEHPLAVAIVNEAKSKGIVPEPIEGFSSITGHGAQGISQGKPVYIGNVRCYSSGYR